ncbi:MAG: Ku protein, partial [Christensenellales bacterium]
KLLQVQLCGFQNKAYQVLLKAMESEKKAGIAKTVLGTKETLLLLRAKNGKMIANTLFFHNEIQEAPVVEKSKPTKQELDLAKNLINQMTSPFEPEKYKDEYFNKLQKAIKRKIAGNEIIEAKDEKEPAKIINLMEALQMSLVTNNSTSRKRKAQ